VIGPGQETTVSDRKPPTPAPTDNGQPARPSPAGPAVIRRLTGAEETDRLVKKHLPAWVISGAVHLVLILVLWLINAGRDASAHEPQDVLTTAVEKEDEPPVKDLTNEDPGIDSTVPAAVDVDKITDKTADYAVTNDQVGTPNTTKEDSVAYAPIGVVPTNDPNPGAPGENGPAQFGSGGAGGTIDAGFLGRSGGTKEKMLREGGGNEASERAVALGLKWLAAQQKPDGGWAFDGDKKEDRIAATGLALLPFLAAGETHKNTISKNAPYRKVVENGLKFLIANQDQSSGRFKPRGTTMYSHGISTIALCEAYGMTKDRALLLGPAQKSINLIMAVQRNDGGWRYQTVPAPNEPGDTSVVGWQVQALQSARMCKDIVVDDKVIKGANLFLDKVSGGGSRKSTYAYVAGEKSAPATRMTAVGLLCRYYISAWGPNEPSMADGVEGLMKLPPKGEGPMTDVYYYYYATQVVHFFGGKEWKDWNEGPLVNGARKGGMRDWLIKLQTTAGPDAGSWPASGGYGGHWGRVGDTCFSLLTLEVYYRHLPLYKRDVGAGVDK
jgi:hypothetical protein